MPDEDMQLQVSLSGVWHALCEKPGRGPQSCNERDSLLQGAFQARVDPVNLVTLHLSYHFWVAREDSFHRALQTALRSSVGRNTYCCSACKLCFLPQRLLSRPVPTVARHMRLNVELKLKTSFGEYCNYLNFMLCLKQYCFHTILKISGLTS